MWGLQHDVEIGSWYDLTNVSFRTFQGKKFLSTTKDTQVSAVDSTHSTCSVERTQSQHIIADIIGAKGKIIHLCPLKHCLPDMPLSCTRVLRVRCDTHYKSSVISVHTSARLTIRSTCNEIKLVHIENREIQSAVQIPHDATPDTITDTLLDLPTMNFTLHQDHVTQLAYPPTYPSRKQAAIPMITTHTNSTFRYR